jgi:outer membrane protein assembly factor BamE (lipoprotein component of BamABCDE complex)
MSGGLHSFEVWLVTLVVTIAILAGFSVFARWCSFGLAVPRRKLDRLHVGMSMDEVGRILGPPREELHDEAGVTHWVYGARPKRHALVIEFNGHNILTSFVHGTPDGAHRRGFPKET